MTAIAIALETFHAIRQTQSGRYFAPRLLILNRSGKLTLIISVILGLALVSYLAALFVSFQLGFSIQEYQSRLAEASGEVADAEFRLQRESSEALLSGASPILNSMEKVTSVKYLSQEESVALQPAR